MAMLNTSMDAEFQNVLMSTDSPLLNSSLYQLKPSSLNLTQDCWATIDITNMTIDGFSITASDSVQAVAADMQTMMSYAVPNTSALDYAQYWSVLFQLNSTLPSLETANKICKEHGVPVIESSAIDFTAECATSAIFYKNYILAKNQTLSPSREDLTDLFKASLRPPYSSMTNSTIWSIGDSLLNHSSASLRVDSFTLFNAPINQTFATAISQCAPSICSSLDFVGNSDLTGTGVIVAYGFITIVSTCLMWMSIYYYYTTQDSKRGKALRTATIETSMVFWDAIIWFAVMVSIASEVYISRLTSFYEYTISIYVEYLVNDAVGALMTLYLYKESVPGKARGLRLLTQLFVIILGVVLFIRNALGLSVDGRGNEIDPKFVDYLCMNAAGIPDTRFVSAPYLVHIGVYIATTVLFGIFAFHGYDCLKLYKAQAQKDKRLLELFYDGLQDRGESPARYAIVLCAFICFIGLWIDFGAVVWMRSKASNLFGTAFKDDTFGYGQIVASGIALQAITSFIWVFISKYTSSY